MSFEVPLGSGVGRDVVVREARKVRRYRVMLPPATSCESCNETRRRDVISKEHRRRDVISNEKIIGLTSRAVNLTSGDKRSLFKVQQHVDIKIR